MVFFKSVLTFIMFMIIILSSDYSGGEIGMTPLAVLIAIGIQLSISSVLFLLFNKFIKNVNNSIFLIFHILVYEFAFLFFTNNIPLMNISETGFTGYINRCYSLSSICSGIIIIISIYLVI
jgi:hypothetical protein